MKKTLRRVLMIALLIYLAIFLASEIYHAISIQVCKSASPEQWAQMGCYTLQ